MTGIGDAVFCGCSSLTSVTIPDSVTDIGERAFYGCSSLTSLTIPDSVASIGLRAFYGCSSLTSLTIPNNSVTSIGNLAFSNCSGLTSLTIPDSVTSIGDYMFYGCSSLTSVTIPAGVSSIGNCAFYFCNNLKVAVLGDNVNIGTTAFHYGSTIYCYKNTDADKWAAQEGYTTVYLDAVNIDDIRTVTLEPDFRLACGESRKVGINIFPDDQSIVTWSSSEPTIVSVDNGIVTALSRGTAAITATVGTVSASVNIIVFSDANVLTLPASTVTIESEAFANLPTVDRIVIPATVTSIADDAFSGSNITIVAPANSYAANWAAEHGVNCINP